ncbi:hypothetical protein [Stakelama tenebrarum]|uniref:STAS domain-containing protein n=1 Tax=Stakelama tenebrarum TaxID=2711215 RepID=A0A6G6Y9Z6_9SPHN|nr:hypothetical protein [Sphingosinithalassobacter tenebrarum]QIG81396.1 hypothetical protein G5C33_17445 [Sphingosinithalassobacter tenebrarum]
MRGTGEPAQLLAHFVWLDELIRPFRDRGESILALVDLRETAIFCEHGISLILAETDKLLRKHDRVAMIVQSSLIKAQLKRTAEKMQRELFLSPHAAITWLTAYSAMSATRL